MATDPTMAATLNLPFKEQIDYFSRKLNLPTERWDDIRNSAHDRAFVVAGAMKADLLADLRASILKHIDGGMGLEGYRRDFKAIVAKHGWTGWTGEGTPGGVAWRTRTTYMTNLRVSHAAGRYQQLTDSPNLRYWMWRHSELAREPRAQHLAWDGMVLPADHPFWKQHYPPQIPPHWGCRCRVVGVETPEDAQALGGEPDKALPEGWQTVDAEYKDPALLAQGWNFAPGAHRDTALRDLVEKKLITLPAAIGAQMWDALAPAIAEERAAAFAGWVESVLADPVKRGRVQVVGALAEGTLGWLAARNITPASAEIAVNDAVIVGKKAARHAAAGDALSADEWARLPAMLDAPERVLYDTRSGNLIYVAAAEDARGAKLAVEFDYQLKKGKGEVNMIVSAFKTPVADIQGAIDGGQYHVVGE